MNPKIAAFTEAMLQNGQNAIALLAEADSEPDEPLLQCYAASLHLYAQTDDATQKAMALLERAKHHTQKLSPTEMLIFEAMQAWSLKSYYHALARFEVILQKAPEDLLTLKYAEWLFYILGQAFNANHFLKICEQLKPYHQQNAYFLSIYAFALELAGKQYEALKVANHALLLNPTLAWAQHAFAHIQLLQGNIQAGVEALETTQGDWSTLTPTLQSHMHWHLSLLHIAKQHESSAVNLFHQHIWTDNDAKNTVLAQQDTLSFLCRMELAGMPQNDLWREVMPQITPACTSPYMVFNSMLYLYACGKNQHDDMAHHILKNAKLYATEQKGPAHTAWLDVGLPALDGIYAYSKANYHACIDAFTPILPQIGCVGGSDAEIELFHMIYCVALLKCNKKNQAKTHFGKHLMHYTNTPLQNVWFSN
ncbi:MAG: hypothetical protein P1U32_02060 [Legionellaceae bacterium]|nr:hypothetical protein [Legionellaceae bacterium]